jgi:hypothetical protein
MVDIESLISWSLPFWDKVAIFSGIAAGVGALGAISIDIAGLVNSEALKARLRFACAFLLVAGAGWQIAATAKITAVTGEIVAYLNDRAQTANWAAAEADRRAGEANKLAAEANERAGEANERASVANERAALAHERARKLELAIEQQRHKNLEFVAQNLAMEEKNAELEARNIELAKGLLEANNRIQDIDSRGRPRTIDELGLQKAVRNLKQASRVVTIVRLDDAESRSYADSLMAALRKQRFVVKVEDLKGTSPLTNVIVCGKDSRDLALHKAFLRASIPSRIIGLRDKSRPSFCDETQIAGAAHTVGSAAPLFTGSTPNTTIKVFVGQRPVKR